MIGILIKSRPVVQTVVGGDNINSPVFNGPANPIITYLERRGHPGNIIRCKDTGEVWASQNRCADVMNISRTSLKRHLDGLVENVDGFRFEILGEAY